jgi:hypothetical protein
MRKHVAGRGGIEPRERGSVNSVFSLSCFSVMIVKEAHRGLSKFFAMQGGEPSLRHFSSVTEIE